MSPEPTSKPWTCPCGKTVHGNGGKSSHQRTCETYHRVQRDSWARNVETWENDPQGGHGHDIRLARQKVTEHTAALNEILARKTPEDPPAAAAEG